MTSEHPAFNIGVLGVGCRTQPAGGPGGLRETLRPGRRFFRDFIQDRIGELIALKHWYCDSTYRYTITDTFQVIIEISDASRRPANNPKADRQRYLVLGHGSHLLDTARYLGGPLYGAVLRLLDDHQQ